MRPPRYADQPQARIRLSPRQEPAGEAAEGAPVAQDPFPQTQLRWRWLGGYRREDVELLLTECRLLLRQVERRIEPMRERERELEAEVSAPRGELAGAKAKAEASKPPEGVLSQAEKLQQTASEQALWLTLLGEREGQTDEERTRLQELLRLNHELLWNVQGLVEGARSAPTATPVYEEPSVAELAAAAEAQAIVEGLAFEPEAAPEPEPEVEPQAALELEPEPEPEPLPEIEASEAVEAPYAESEPEPEPEPEIEPEPEQTPEPELVAASAPVARTVPRDLAPEREELERARQRAEAGFAATVSFSPARAVFAAAAALLVLAIVLAAIGHATAAVILLAVFALGIAFLSVFGIGIEGNGVPMTARAPSSALVPGVEDRYEQARTRKELAQLAAERDRRLLELGEAVASRDDVAVVELRDRIRELDELIQERAIGFASQRRAPAGRPVALDAEELLY